MVVEWLTTCRADQLCLRSRSSSTKACSFPVLRTLRTFGCSDFLKSGRRGEQPHSRVLRVNKTYFKTFRGIYRLLLSMNPTILGGLYTHCASFQGIMPGLMYKQSTRSSRRATCGQTSSAWATRNRFASKKTTCPVPFCDSIGWTRAFCWFDFQASRRPADESMTYCRDRNHTEEL